MTSISTKRFIFREDAREEAAEMFGELVSLSVLAIADTNRNFNVYSPVGTSDKGEMVLTGPFIRIFDDMIEEAA
jgi:hypothetical protein